jgi:hypothetical protein
MKELLLKAIELPVADRYRLAFLLAESLGYVLIKERTRNGKAKKDTRRSRSCDDTKAG